MQKSLSDLADNLPEGIYGNKYEDCKSYIDF